VAIQAPEKIPDCSRPDVVPRGVAFSLYVNAVQAKRVLVDHAIDTVVASAAQCTAGIGSCSALPHTEKKGYDQPFEKFRRGFQNSIEKVLRKRRFNLRVRRSHHFIRRLRLFSQYGQGSQTARPICP